MQIRLNSCRAGLLGERRVYESFTTVLLGRDGLDRMYSQHLGRTNGRRLSLCLH